MIVRRFITPIVLAATLLVGTSAHAQSPADVDAARELFKKGAEFAQKGQWNEARQSYEKSLALKRSPRTLYSLGIAYRNLFRFVESLESYRAFLVEMSKTDDKPYEQAARDAVAELEKQVARVDITVVAPDEDAKLTLTVDGIIVPEAAYGVPRLVDPGTHTILLHADGYQDAKQSVTLSEGAKEAVTLRLAKQTKTGPTLGPDKPKTEWPILPTALLISGSATFAMGLTIGLVGVQRASDAPTRDGKEALAARRLGVAGDIMGSLGIIAAGTGLTLLLVDKFAKPHGYGARPPVARIVPFVGPGNMGVVGQF